MDPIIFIHDQETPSQSWTLNIFQLQICSWISHKVIRYTMTTSYPQQFDIFYHVEFEGRDDVLVQVFVMTLYDTT